MPPNPLFTDRIPVWAELDGLLDQPEFHPNLSGIATTYRRTQAFIRTLGPASKVLQTPGRLLAGMEWAGIVDPAVMHAAMVNYGAAATIAAGGRDSDDLGPHRDRIDEATSPGVIVATELGRGGSQVSMRTEAHWNPQKQVFNLHTPDDAAMKVMPNVGWTGIGRTAVVNARLLHNDTDYGIHAFVVPFPHPDIHVTPLPGTTPGVPLDFSLIRFDGVAVPAGCWLADSSSVDSDGTIHDPLPPLQRMARSLHGVNTALAAGTVAYMSAARAAVTIAARFNTQRHITADAVPALTFTTHRADLASALARVHTTGLFVEHARSGFIDEHHQPGDTTAVDNSSYAPWVAANRDRPLAKVAAAETLEHTAATARRLCGFHGALHVNRIATYEDFGRVGQATGGDSRLLLLEAGKQLAANPHGAPPVTTVNNPASGDPTTARQLTALRERAMRADLAQQLDQHGGPAAMNAGDWNPHLVTVEELARVHLARRVLDNTATALDNTPPGAWRDTLTLLHQLHALDVLLEHAAWHLNHGTLRPGDLDTLRRTHSTTVDRVIDQLDTAVDALAVPAGRIGGLIGRTDYVHRFAALVNHP